MSQQAIKALKTLKRLCPQLGNYQVSSIYYSACDEHCDWDVAQGVADIFADNISEINLENRLLKHLLASGWSVAGIDNWLAQKPKGKNSFWVKERLRFNVKHDRAEELLDQLAAATSLLTLLTAAGPGAPGSQQKPPAQPAPVNPYNGMQEREEVYEFTQKPVVTRRGDNVTISFESKGFCDVTVSLRTRTGRLSVTWRAASWGRMPRCHSGRTPRSRR